jgi:hypothetical protein
MKLRYKVSESSNLRREKAPNVTTENFAPVPEESEQNCTNSRALVCCANE